MLFSKGGCTQGFNTFLTALKLPRRKAGSWVLNPFNTNKKYFLARYNYFDKQPLHKPYHLFRAYVPVIRYRCHLLPAKIKRPKHIIPAPPAGGLHETPHPAPQRPRKPSHHKMRGIHENQPDKPLLRRFISGFSFPSTKAFCFVLSAFAAETQPLTV
jgi:hypothetical protein